MTLGRAYDEIMEHVAVTEQMRQRILTRVADTDFAPSASVPRAPAARRYWAAAACAALLLAGAAVLPRYLDFQHTVPRPGQVETVPGFREVSSLAELEAAVGFEVEVLETLPFEVTDTVYTAFGSEMAEIRYCGETETAVLRKAVGMEDPSGDYTQYEEERTLSINGTSVVLKGENGRYVLALWQKGAYGCSLRLTEGVDPETWEQLLQPLS